MHEYKFVKYIYPTQADGQESFEASYGEKEDESQLFGYQEIIQSHAKEGWKLNSAIPFTSLNAKHYYPKGLDLIFERTI